MSDHILGNGRLTAADLNRVEQYARMGANVNEIEGLLASATNKSVKDIDRLIVNQMNDVYKESSVFYKARGIKQVPITQNRRAVMLARSISNRTMASIRNISHSTGMFEPYKQLLDESIMLVHQGVDDYERVIRKSLKQAEDSGLYAYTDQGITRHRQRYMSGYKRRLDSAIRLNLREGLNQITAGIREIAGQEFGADGVEISAHELCAEDHIDIQGQQMSYKEFEELNNELDRPIGELNCQHEAIPIILGVSKPRYSEEELGEMRDRSNEEIQLSDDVSATRYQCSQKMRELETKIRREKETYIGAKTDIKRRSQAQAKITKYKKQYSEISDKADISVRPELLRVSGYTGR